MNSYCSAAAGHPLHDAYHSTEYGFPQDDESILFERLGLEIMQAGLSWTLVLRRRDTMRKALASYDVDRIVAMGPADEARLPADPGIIRNRLKVRAIILNAERVKEMRKSHGGFTRWLKAHHSRNKADWVKLFKKTFRFTGGEIVGEFLMSLGYLPGAHSTDCHVHTEVLARHPPWARDRDAKGLKGSGSGAQPSRGDP